MEKAIIIGATSGIGKGLAKILSKNGYVVGIAARRAELLSEIQKDLPGKTFIKEIDISHPMDAVKALKELIWEMRGMDIIVISSGVCFDNPDLDWEKEKSTIDVNVTGFASLAGAAFAYFTENGSGHIVGISSVRGLRGGWSAPAYNASKAFVSNYLEGLRIKAKKMKADVCISDIRPGFIETPMTMGKKAGFTMASADTACRQIFKAITRKRRLVYVTKRWALIAFLIRNMPYRVYRWM